MAVCPVSPAPQGRDTQILAVCPVSPALQGRDTQILGAQGPACLAQTMSVRFRDPVPGQ